LLAGTVGVAAYVAYRVNQPRPRTWRDDFSFSPFEVQVPSEDVSFCTEDGLTIRGWFFPRQESRRVIVCCTGHRGSKPDLLGIGSSLWRAGNNVLLFDFRGCGESDPSPISLAHREVHDARAAVGYVARRLPGAAIGLLGFSMGGAVSIRLAAVDLRVSAVVSDSSFTSIRDVVAHHMRRHRMPPHVVPLADVVNRWRYGYPFAAVRPIDAVSAISPRPLFLIHGEADDLIPVKQGLELFAAAGEPRELWIVPGARHCGAYFADRMEYVARVSRFFEDALPASSAFRTSA
jgi:alpha-beta hydrolase superfamily lysophospholipase